MRVKEKIRVKPKQMNMLKFYLIIIILLLHDLFFGILSL